MEWTTTLVLTIAALAVFFPVAFIWYLCIGGVCLPNQGKRVKLSSLTCSADVDCPPSHVCVNGRCVPQKA